MNNLDMNKIRKSLAFHIFSRFAIAMVIFTGALIAIFLFFLFIAGRFIWYDSIIYRILKTLSDNRNFVFVFVWSIGFVFIFFRYWRRTFGYIESMIDASNALVSTDEELIHLPAELKEVEVQMNQVKYDMLRNERAAKEAEQRKNDLVAYLAHDLKTPLTSVIGYITLLKDELQISEELREKYLAISLEKAERLEDLINEFFEITRFNLTNLTLELSRVNLTRMLDQITFEFKPMLSPKNLTCTLKSNNDLMIKIDVKKMERVFDNLIRNAINYSFENREIEISATQNEKGVVLKFFNHGNTIPEQKLNHIFEQFYRLDAARTSKTGGAGLGLAIAKEIVELHKGTITASSENEKIEFEIFLPTLP